MFLKRGSFNFYLIESGLFGVEKKLGFLMLVAIYLKYGSSF